MQYLHFGDDTLDFNVFWFKIFSEKKFFFWLNINQKQVFSITINNFLIILQNSREKFSKLQKCISNS
jgi:hypothetical protein